jgi:hypothetical protein
MKVVKGYKQSLKHEVKNNFKRLRNLKKVCSPSYIIMKFYKQGFHNNGEGL